MANYVVPPDVLKPFVPAGTQLDFWEGKCYISLVGFMFMNTKLKGLCIPFHSRFEEVNLRFYVNTNMPEPKRGVVFVKEIVTKPAVSLIANSLYHENYVTMKMENFCYESESELHVEYNWKDECWNCMAVKTDPIPKEITPGSIEEFITEHYYGYTKRNEHNTYEYRVDHPRWKIYPVHDHLLDVQFGKIYGSRFAFLNNAAPNSVLLAEGSEVTVAHKEVLTQKEKSQSNLTGFYS